MNALRRTFIAALITNCLVTFGVSAPAAAQNLPKITIGLVNKDGSGILPTYLANNDAIKKQVGIDVEVKQYPSVPAVWTGFAAGEVEATIGGPANFATIAAKGAPVQIVSTYAVFDASIYGKKKIEKADDLRGKRLTAIMAGLWKLTEAQIKEKFGLVAGTDYQLIPVPNLMAGATQVLAGTADFAMGWEPDVTRVAGTYKELVPALTSTDLRPKGEVSNNQVIGIQGKVSSDVIEKLLKALALAAAEVNKDPAAAEAMYIKLTGAEPGPFVKAVREKKYLLDVHPLTEADRKIIASDLSKVLPEATLPNGFLK